MGPEHVAPAPQLDMVIDVTFHLLRRRHATE